MKKSIKELRDIHDNTPVAVLGGGPSLPGDLKKLHKETILIGVNYHFHRLTNADYMVFMDKGFLTRNADFIKNIDAIKISQYAHQSDYLLDVDFWDGGFSSTLATWLAGYISSGPVLLCGMDCYQGKEKYFYDIQKPLTHRTYTSSLESNLKAWSHALEKTENPERIKAVSGPLVQLFGKYDT